MPSEADHNRDSSRGWKRREVLSSGACAIAATGGLWALSGSAAAWEREVTDYRGSQEVWIVVDETDLPSSPEYPDEYPEHLEVTVIVDEGDGLECRRVPVTNDLTTTAPDHYGDDPVIKYRTIDDNVVLGVIWLSPASVPLRLDVNDHESLSETERESVFDADCVPADIETLPPEVGDEDEESTTDENGEPTDDESTAEEDQNTATGSPWGGPLRVFPPELEECGGSLHCWLRKLF